MGTLGAGMCPKDYAQPGAACASGESSQEALRLDMGRHCFKEAVHKAPAPGSSPLLSVPRAEG